jgi:HK97 family phage major capsid protein
MKTSIILKEERSDIISQLEAIKDVATTENRDLSSEENNEVDGLITEVDNLDAKIERSEKLETIKRNSAVVSGITATKKDKDLEKFTFQGAIRAAHSGNVSGLYKELDQEARNEARYTGQSFKGYAIPSSILTRASVESTAVNSVETMSFTDQLEANLVLASAGANFYGGVNSMKFPIFSGIDSTFVSEDGSNGTVATNGTATSVSLTPSKLISIVNMSQEAMVQNPGLEAALRRNMAANIASTLEGALLGNSDVTNAPDSIFLDAAQLTDGALNKANVNLLEETVLAANVNLQGARMAYLMNPAGYSKVRTEAQVADVSAVYDMRDKTVNGYFSFISSNVGQLAAGKDAAIFGDFSKVHIAQFGGLDILFDPYTNSATGQPRMVITGLYGGAALQAASAFAAVHEA